MYILIKASNTEYFVVVMDRTRLKELLWLLEGTLHPLDLVCLSVETEAIRDPALIPAKDQDFSIIESKATHSVSRRPVTLSVNDL